MPSTATRVNIPELLAHSRLGPLQKRVFTLCLLTLIIDGFDVQAMGYVIPALSAAWHIEPAQFRTVLPAANFGVLIGSLLSSRAPDRSIRPVIAFVIFASGLKYAGLGTTALGWTLGLVALACGGLWLARARPWRRHRKAEPVPDRELRVDILNR